MIRERYFSFKIKIEPLHILRNIFCPFTVPRDRWFNSKEKFSTGKGQGIMATTSWEKYLNEVLHFIADTVTFCI